MLALLQGGNDADAVAEQIQLMDHRAAPLERISDLLQAGSCLGQLRLGQSGRAVRHAQHLLAFPPLCTQLQCSLIPCHSVAH
jgi:hypothetical protein